VVQARVRPRRCAGGEGFVCNDKPLEREVRARFEALRAAENADATENPDDESVAMDADENLPWPAAELVRNLVGEQ
jgi:hypothetical protein